MIKLFKNMAASLVSVGVLMSMGLCVTAYAADETYEDVPVDPYESFLIDDADMLTVPEEDTLTEKIQATAEYIDMNILVFVSGTTIYSESNTQMFCEEICVDYYGYDADSIVLYLDLSGHDNISYSPYDFFYTRNRARFYYTSSSDSAEDRISEIFDEMNPYLPRGDEDVYAAVEKFLSNVEYYYNKGPSNLRYYYIPDTGKYVTLKSDGTLVHSDSRPKNWGSAAVIGIVSSLIITLITFFFIKSHYKFKSAPSSLHYMAADRVQYGPESDVFIRKYQIRRKRQSSSGGGSHGGGGGTHSGGGGGGNRR